MVRSSRHLAVAAVAGGAAALIAPGCTSPDACPAAESSYQLVEPAGFAQKTPTGPAIEIAWTIDSDATSFHLDLAPSGGATGAAVPLADLGPGARTFAFAGASADGAPVPPGNYAVRMTLRCGDVTNDTVVDGGPLHLVVVQGVRFRDAALAFTADQADRHVVLTTVTRTQMELELAVADAAGPPRVFARALIPGELVPFERSYPFTGQDIDGTDVPAGTYAVLARVRAPGAGESTEVAGPTLTWTPGSAP